MSGPVPLPPSAPVNARDGAGRTAIHRASAAGDYEGAVLLVRQGARVQDADHRGETPLHRAAAGGHLRICLLLLACGAPVNAATPRGTTPLHEAVCGGHAAVVRTLLRAGGDTELQPQEGGPPLWMAVSRERWDVAQLLADGGASPVADGTPLVLACERGPVELCRALLRHPDARRDADTLQRCLRIVRDTREGGRSELVRALLDAGGE